MKRNKEHSAYRLNTLDYTSAKREIPKLNVSHTALILVHCDSWIFTDIWVPNITLSLSSIMNNHIVPEYSVYYPITSSWRVCVLTRGDVEQTFFNETAWLTVSCGKWQLHVAWWLQDNVAGSDSGCHWLHRTRAWTAGRTATHSGI